MLSTDSFIVVYALTGLSIGFGHCIGMCGPLVVSFTLNLQGRSIWLPHLLYNLGRIITYTLLGGLLGISGSFTILTARIAVLQKGIMVVAGLLIIFMGLRMAGWLPGSKGFLESTPTSGRLVRWFSRLQQTQSGLAYLPLGLLLGLLPCGPVYTSLLGAVRVGMEAGSPLQAGLWGAGLMAAFGLGTVPSLILVAKLADLGWLSARVVIYRLGAVIMILMGGYFIYKGVVY